MKNILCYGDSNTFGLEAETLERFRENKRWIGILSLLLKNEYNVIEEGLSDRNAFLTLINLINILKKEQK